MHRSWRRQALPGGGLLQVSPRRYRALQGARRRQTLSARGLPHCCSTRQAALSHAWWWHALPARGLHQVGSRRHRALRGARRRHVLPAGRLLQVRSSGRYTSLVMNLQSSILMAQMTRSTSPHCVAHGGGKRCQHEGCTKSALGDTEHCAAHGGGRRCQHLGCPKAAATGGTRHCVAHGGGRRCQKEGCCKAVFYAPGSVYCRLCLQRDKPDDA
jgi:hypothetical protein